MKKIIMITTFTLISCIVVFFSYYKINEKTLIDTNFSKNNISLECRNINGNYSSLIESGDKIDCYLLYDESIVKTAKQINFNLEIGKDITLIDTSYNKDEYLDITKKNNQYRIKIDDIGYYQQGIITFTFEINENPTSEGLYILLDNIFYKSAENKIFRVKDFTKLFTIKSDDYFIYKINEEIVVKNYRDEENSNNLITKYECYAKKCEYITYNEKYLLFDDNGLTIFDYTTLEKSRIANEEINQYYNYTLVVDQELVGIIVNDKLEEKYGYFSIKNNEFVVEFSEKNINIFHYNKYLIVEQKLDEKNYTYQILNYEGKKYIPTMTDLIQLKDSKYYYFEPYYEGDQLYFYYENGSELFDGNAVKYFGIENNNLILADGLKFYVYQNNKLLKVSNEYKKILDIIDGYILIMDSDNKIKLLNSNEQIIAELFALEEQYLYNYTSYDKEHNEVCIYVYDNIANIDYKVIYNIINKTIVKIEN